MAEFIDRYIRVKQLKEMLNNRDDEDFLTVAIDGKDYVIVGIQDSTCIGFWELRCEKVE
jgi:hypothetical protein